MGGKKVDKPAAESTPLKRAKKAQNRTFPEKKQVTTLEAIWDQMGILIAQLKAQPITFLGTKLTQDAFLNLIFLHAIEEGPAVMGRVLGRQIPVLEALMRGEPAPTLDAGISVGGASGGPARKRDAQESE